MGNGYAHAHVGAHQLFALHHGIHIPDAVTDQTVHTAVSYTHLSPIGASQAAETGRSIMYMLEANPGPGLGVLQMCIRDRR